MIKTLHKSIFFGMIFFISNCAHSVDPSVTQEYLTASKKHLLGENGKTKNPKKAFKLYKMAAKYGNSDAQTLLGLMYLDGLGVKQNYKKALKWLLKAAQNGEALAQENLGHIYREGLGVAKNPYEAIVWYRIAAYQGDAEAQYHLGLTLVKTFRGKKNSEAFAWILRSAKQGYRQSEFFLGTLYQFGDGVEQNNKQALRWYKKAAEKGHAMAPVHIAMIYSSRKGVERNTVKAYMWCLIASNDISKKFLKSLEEEMPHQQIEKAKKMAEEWMQAHCQNLEIPCEQNIILE